MSSVQHTINPEAQPAAELASLPYPLISNRRLLHSDFIQNLIPQPSRPTKFVKRVLPRGAADSSAPRARFEQTATVVGQDILLIGGQTITENSNSTLATGVVNVSSTTLDVNEQNAKISVTGHGAVSIGGSKVLIVFGLQSTTPMKLADPPLQLLDAQTLNTAPLPTIKGQQPPARFGHTVTLVNKRAYIIGGLGFDTPGNNWKPISDVHYLDLGSMTWTTFPLKPNAAPLNFAHKTVAVNQYLISCFGLDSKEEVHNNCNVFDTVSNSFVDAKISGTPPSPRQEVTMTASSDGSTIVVFGGSDRKNKTFDDFFVLDASKAPNLQWAPYNASSKSKSLVPSPRSGHSSVGLGDGKVMMVWGGVVYTPNGGQALVDSNVYFLDTSTKTWIDLSSTKTILGINAKTVTNSSTAPSSSNSSNPVSAAGGSPVGLIIGVVAAVVVVVAVVALILFRKRRLARTGRVGDREASFDPYIRPGGQLHGSNTDLTLDNESKGTFSWDQKEHHEVVMLESIKTDNIYIEKENLKETNASPPTREYQAWNNQSRSDVSFGSLKDDKVNDSQTSFTTVTPSTTRQSETLQQIPLGANLPASPLPAASSESKSRRTKKTHRRTSSVSITAADMHRLSTVESITIAPLPQRPFQNSSHRPRSSLSNVINSSDLYSSNDNNDSRHTSQSSSTMRSSLTNTQKEHVSPISSGGSSPTASYTFSKQNERNSKASSKSVNSLQWVGFNSSMLDEQEEKRLSLHVRNAMTLQSDQESLSTPNPTVYWEGVEPPEDGYIVYGEYMDTIPDERHSYSGNFLDHDEVAAAYDRQRRRSAPHAYPPKPNKGKPLEADIAEEDEFETISMNDDHGPFLTPGEIYQAQLQAQRESDILDPLGQEVAQLSRGTGKEINLGPFVSSEEKEEMIQKSKRSSSKRTSRVSFAMKDEKIEFDETASSKSVSLVRFSGNSSGQGTTIPRQIIEDSEDQEYLQRESHTAGTAELSDEEDFEDEDFVMEKHTSKIDLSQPLRLYEEDEQDYSSGGSRLSRFSFSVYDFKTDTPLPANASSIAAAAREENKAETGSSPHERSKSPDIRDSIANLVADEGVIWALHNI